MAIDDFHYCNILLLFFVLKNNFIMEVDPKVAPTGIDRHVFFFFCEINKFLFYNMGWLARDAHEHSSSFKIKIC